MLALNPADRDSLANLVFSMLTGKLGDAQLSGLMVMANIMRNDINREILDVVGKDSEHLPLLQLIDKFIEEISKGVGTNYGNLRPALTNEELEDGAEPHPPRTLK